MAARCVKMAAACDESSSEDEALQRCREAVWDAQALRRTDENEEKQSKRLVVAEHEHDGNELQVTQGFRTHVSKKLVHFLDSYISETQPETSACAEPSNGGGDDDVDDDEGFRLFSTSVPGQIAEEPVTPVRRRPAPSSSDSDSEMEMRLKEAAVSIKDLLPSLSLPESLTKEKKKKQQAEGEESPVIQKENEEESETKGFGSAPQSNGAHRDSDQEDTPLRVKKKKKKKKKLNEEETDQVSKSECAVPLSQRGDHRNSELEKVKKKKKKRQEASD
ncbi:protein CUSTOS [Genypterus blacodes]|uniref:protein CUSTOS n=1 Tax=Genypterus blacodes TaxID=154954 RepID=UPI003F75F70A